MAANSLTNANSLDDDNNLSFGYEGDRNHPTRNVSENHSKITPFISSPQPGHDNHNQLLRRSLANRLKRAVSINPSKSTTLKLNRKTSNFFRGGFRNNPSNKYTATSTTNNDNELAINEKNGDLIRDIANVSPIKFADRLPTSQDCKNRNFANGKEKYDTAKRYGGNNCNNHNESHSQSQSFDILNSAKEVQDLVACEFTDNYLAVLLDKRDNKIYLLDDTSVRFGELVSPSPAEILEGGKITNTQSGGGGSLNVHQIVFDGSNIRLRGENTSAPFFLDPSTDIPDEGNINNNEKDLKNLTYHHNNNNKINKYLMKKEELFLVPTTKNRTSNIPFENSNGHLNSNIDLRRQLLFIPPLNCATAAAIVNARAAYSNSDVSYPAPAGTVIKCSPLSSRPRNRCSTYDSTTRNNITREIAHKSSPGSHRHFLPANVSPSPSANGPLFLKSKNNYKFHHQYHHHNIHTLRTPPQIKKAHLSHLPSPAVITEFAQSSLKKEMPFTNMDSSNKRVRNLPEHRVRIKRPDADPVDIVIRSFSLGIDPGPIQIDESSDSIFRFKTPYFRGKATLEIPPLDFRETWIFGWIQACYDLKFVNTYGKYGYSCWSIPGLNGTLEKSISDSDGKKFPWYGIRPDEIFVCSFPTHKTQTKEICMSDNFYPHVTWDYPGDRFESPKLTKVLRDQRFYVWLVGMNSTLRQIYVLKAAKWRMKVTVKLDPNMPLGSRTISVSGKLTPPQIFFAGDRSSGCVGSGANSISKYIPLQVLSPPSANTCQILTWVPKGKISKSVVVIPAKRYTHHNERKDSDELTTTSKSHIKRRP